MTPACIAALYQVPPGDKAHPVNAMEIFEFRDNYGNSSLDIFFTKFAPQVPQGTCPTEANIEFTDYATVQPGESGEADLDFDVAYPWHIRRHPRCLRPTIIFIRCTVQTSISVCSTDSWTALMA